MGLCAVYKRNTRNRNGSDSDEDKYYASQESEDKEEPRPPSQRSSISHPSSPDYSASSSEDEDYVGNVAGQQPQSSQWTLPRKPRRRVVHAFIGAPLSERCWYGLGMSHDHSCLQADQPKLLDWTQVTISTGLASITRNADVACVQQGA